MSPGRKAIQKTNLLLAVRIVITTLLIITTYIIIVNKKQDTNQFDKDRAFQDVTYQLSLGPRVIGSSAHAQFIKWATNELNKAGWETQLQTYELEGEQLTNIIATRNPSNTSNSWILLGAHYDSRFFADQDANFGQQQLPVPGANDGASGVAVLLEIARSLPEEIDKNVEIVLFDAEDNGDIRGWEWIIGSRIFVSRLITPLEAVLIIDMVGDSDLNIYMERNSDKRLTNQIWDVANDLGYHQFITEYKYQILDDHIPFIEAGIPAADIIDFDYPYWHTTQDTLDKISPDSLDVVGEVILTWLQGY